MNCKRKNQEQPAFYYRVDVGEFRIIYDIEEKETVRIIIVGRETLSNSLCGIKRKAHGAQEPKHI